MYSILTSLTSSIQTILVPQGAEFQAVCRGLRRAAPVSAPVVLPIPIGVESVTRHLKQLQQMGYFSPPHQVLIMGLAGSLTPRYAVGAILIYQDCVYSSQSAHPVLQQFDRSLTALLHDRLQPKASLVKGLTSDRLIWSAESKQRLGEQYNADAVDMEGFAVLQVLGQAGAAVSMLRVVSDDCQHDLPDLTPAISPKGSLQPLPLAVEMIRKPIAAARFIQGALQGLKALQAATVALFRTNVNY
jgi:hypothetical protein